MKILQHLICGMSRQPSRLKGSNPSIAGFTNLEGLVAQENPSEYFEEEVSEDTEIGLPFKVILYNDDWHSFDEVILQLIKAVHCSYEEARGYAFEVHVKGKSVVFAGSINKCLRVSSILEQIALNTQVVSDE